MTMRLIANRSARNLLIGGTLGAAIALAIGYGPAIAQNGGAAGKPSVVATVRLSAVLEKLDQRGEAEANLNALAQKVKGDEKTRKDEIQKMQDQLEELRKAAGDAVDPGAEITDLQEQVAQKTLQLQAWSRFTVDKVDIEKSLLMQDLYRNIKTAAQTMATANGYDLVLVDDSQAELSTTGDSRVSREAQVVQQIAARQLLYVNPALDITDQIITRMNNAHKAAGGAPTAGAAGGNGGGKPQN